MNQIAMSLPLPTIGEACVGRDAGIQRATDHAETVESGWSASTLRVLIDYARNRETFTSEDFREHLQAIDFPCPVPKALGAVFQKAARAAVIKRLGYAVSRERHASPCPLWGRA